MKWKQIGKRLAVVSAAVVLSAAATVTVWAKTKLDTVSEVYWNEDEDNDNKMTEAVWESVEDANQYEVALYRDGSKVTEVTVKASKNSYNFKRKMDKEGDYTFRVRALAKKSSSEYANGSWSDYSDGLYITEARAEYNKGGAQEDTSKTGPGAPAGGTEGSASLNSGVIAENSQKPTASNTTEEKVVAENSRKPVAEGSSSASADSGQLAQEDNAEPKTGEWVNDSTGWWYRWSDGTYPAGNWFQDPADGKYYMMDGQGYIRTGWITWNEKRYYCDASATPSGAMVTGEHYIDGMLYRFDDSGAMIDEAITSGGSSRSEDDDED